MWPGLDLEFQFTRVRDERDRQVLGIKLRALIYTDECRKILRREKIGFAECEDGFLLRIESYQKAAEQLRKVVPVRLLPDHLYKLLIHAHRFQSIHSLSENDLKSMIPSLLWKAAKPYQLDGLRYIVQHEGRAQIADEMGLGKTFQGILWAFVYKKTDGPILIVTPATLCKNWGKKELTKWCSMVDSNFDPKTQITYLETERDCLQLQSNEMKRKDHYYIVAYSIVQRLNALQALVKQNFQMVLGDETQAVKNELAKRCIAMQALCATAKRVLLLSGTPGVRPLEMFTQFSIVAPFVFPENLKWETPKGNVFARLNKDKTRENNYKMPFSFVSRWCDPFMESTYRHHKQWNKLGGARLEELHALGKEFVFIRRTQKEVLSQELPELTRSYLRMDIEYQAAEKIELTVSKMNQAAAEHQDYERKKCFMEMYNDLPRIKGGFVRNHVRTTILEERMKQHKCIIFAHHKEMIALIEDECKTILVEFNPLHNKKNSHSSNKRKGIIKEGKANKRLKMSVNVNESLLIFRCFPAKNHRVL